MSKLIHRYKYVPRDDSFEDLSNKGSLSIIRDGTMKFTHPEEFNDPFDCYPEIDLKKAREDWVNSKECRMEHDLSPAKYLQEKPKILKNLEKHHQNLLEILNNQVGICSLSKNPLNLLMWAHYASSHTGFVVEFGTPMNFFGTKEDDYIRTSYLISNPVKYQTAKPTITNLDEIECFEQWCLTKAQCWEYEKEERVMDYERKAGIHPYNRKRILKSVIAGVKMKDEDFMVLKNAVEEINNKDGTCVTVHKAEPIRGKFALCVPDRDDLDIHNTHIL